MAIKKLEPLGRVGMVKRRVPWLCFFLCLGGATLICIGGKACMLAWQARGWQALPCTIGDSEIDSTYKPGHSQEFKFSVSYHYTFDNQEYHSQSATLDPDAEMDLNGVGALSNRYPNGAHATCYVNPQEPSQAVLDRSVPRRDVAATAGGVVLVMGSFAGLMATKRRK
jgi:hypothetical protein